MSIKTNLTVYLLIFLLNGCSLNFQGLMTAKGLADNQEEMGSYINTQKQLFEKLKTDVENGRLKKGMPKNEALAMYGEPILSRPSQDQARAVEYLLYRHPVKYFSSDLIYLYFDKDGRLTCAQVGPASDKK